MRSVQEELEAQDPLRVASNAYGLLLENDRARVLRLYLKPGDKAAMHSHPDHIIYVVKGSKGQIVSSSGNMETLDMETGKALFLEAQSHEATNVGDADLELIVVELK